MLTALSRAGAARGFRPATLGRLAGGAGGAGFAFAAATDAAPLAVAADLGAVGGGGGGAGFGAAATCSSRYAWGAHPWTPVVGFSQSHHPEELR